MKVLQFILIVNLKEVQHIMLMMDFLTYHGLHIILIFKIHHVIHPFMKLLDPNLFY